MASDEVPDDAAVFDFLDEFLRDLERGTRQPLTHYLERYKGHEEAVAGEYFAELERAGISSVQKSPSAAAEINVGDLESDPQRVGPYRLVRELGRGGQGAVWLAEDTRIARSVALKLLPAEFAALSTERRRRLQREAEVIARLDHPCLCAVLDARIDGERPYIAMRYVEGATLGEWIARARESRKAAREGKPAPTTARVVGPVLMAPRTALGLAGLLMFFERAARALHAAHEVGVVHRDVKPQNVMVTRSGDPVVLDFGQARDDSSDSFELTRSGDVLGTPAYMSPEQILGVREGVDRRTDVWSLGASLYEALTLVRAFEAESVPALFMAIRGARLPDPRTLNPTLPTDLSLVVATALEKDPLQRYQTALDFAEDLRRVREYEPVRARPPSAWRVFRAWFQRHPALAYSTLGSILALSIGLASSLYLLREVRSALAYKNGLLLGHRTDELIQEDPSAALALGIEAVKAAPEYETRASLFRALQACHLRSVIDSELSHRTLDCDVSPDGRSVAIGLDDGGVRICDLETGKTQLVVRKEQPLAPGETREVRDVDFSPDGARLAFCSPDKQACVADARSGAMLTEVPMPAGESRAIEFLGGGERLLALSDSGAICVDAHTGTRLWSWTCPTPQDPERESKLAVHAGTARALVWSVDKQKPESSRAWLIDTSSGLALAELSAAGGVLCAEFRRDGLRFATGSADGSVRVWNSDSGQLERAYDAFVAENVVRVVRFAPDGLRLVALLEHGQESRAWLMYMASGAPVPIGNPGVRVVHAAFSPDGQRLATIGTDMIVRLWSGTDNHEEQSFRGRHVPREVSWSPDGRRLVTTTVGAIVSVWYAGARPDVFGLQANKSPVRCARFSPDGERVVVASDDGMARVWAAPSIGSDPHDRGAPESGELLFSLRHGAAVRDAAYSPDAASIATVSDDGSARLWSASDGKPRGVLLEGEPKLAAISFSSDGAYVAVRSETGRVFLCDSACQHPSRELDVRSPVTSMVWLPTRAELVTGHAENVIRRFDAQDGALLEEQIWPTPKSGLAAGTVALAARADGAEIAVACVDANVRFFEPGVKSDSIKTWWMITPQSIAYNADSTRLLVTGPVGRGALRLQKLGRDRKTRESGQKERVTVDFTDEIGQKVLHAGDVTGGSFSPDGRWVITTSKEGGAYVRDSEFGLPFAHFLGPQGLGCFAGAISPGAGAARALVAFGDGSVWVWPLDPLAPAEARKPRELNRYERERENLAALPGPQPAAK